MVQWIEALASKPAHLSSIPRIYMVEGENHSCKSPSDLHVCHRVPWVYVQEHGGGAVAEPQTAIPTGPALLGHGVPVSQLLRLRW